jgi:predicted nuclease of predicted toxin-antitoxin system
VIIWIDAQLSPSIASWIEHNFPVESVALRDIGLRDSEDEDIFKAARSAGAVIMTKDADFLKLLDRYGAPPQIIWVTCGNSSNKRLKEILTIFLADALMLLDSEEPLIEVRASKSLLD